MEELDIYKMELHDSAQIRTRGVEILRVPGGWIYSLERIGGTIGAMAIGVFVPFSEEFKNEAT